MASTIEIIFYLNILHCSETNKKSIYVKKVLTFYD